VSSTAIDMVSPLMTDLLGFDRHGKMLAADLDEVDFRRYGPRLAGIASVNV
jgi:hypothetical protein